jgi:putative flavoprotein involved in K+ transport
MAGGRSGRKVVERIDTLVIGGSQAGLAVSYHLTREGRPHLVLERHRVGASWIGQRWDSFTLVTPNWMNQLPGFSYRGDDPDGFLGRDEVVTYLEDYAAFFGAPIRFGIEARRLRRQGDGHRVETSDGIYDARNVVVATGSFRDPKIPGFAGHISDVHQLHSSAYRDPDALPAGAVLVVGSAQSGCQIAEELREAGRHVYLSVSGAGRLPRRYRGKDMLEWQVLMGRMERSFEDPADPVERHQPNPHLSGKAGGHAINLHDLARTGITLLGRVVGVQGRGLALAPDLLENVAKADRVAAERKRAVDDHIARTGLEVAPADSANTDDGGPCDGPPLEQPAALDLTERGVSTIVWATGYRCDFSWIDLPALDSFGYPIQHRGVSSYPGLYFCGLHWMHCNKSGLIYGVGDDARHVTRHLAAHRPAVG